MEQTLLRSYLATVYEFQTASGPLRASIDGAAVQDQASLPELLQRPFVVLTAYNPRSMLLPRKVNDQRHHVMRDMLILGVPRARGASRHGSCTAWIAARRSPSVACSGRTRSSSTPRDRRSS